MEWDDKLNEYIPQCQTDCHGGDREKQRQQQQIHRGKHGQLFLSPYYYL